MHEGGFLMVEGTDDAACRLRADIAFYRGILWSEAGWSETGGSGKGAPLLLPGPAGPSEAGERARTIDLLAAGGIPPEGLITSVAGFEAPVHDPRLRVEARRLLLEAGGEYDRAEIERGLLDIGYRRVSLVTEPGHYSLRGFILDVFPAGGSGPVRIEFFGDGIEDIRAFDVDTQRSIEQVDAVSLYPAREPDAEEGVPLGGLLGDAVVLCSEAAAPAVPEGALVLSPYAIGGEGVDAGCMSLAGLGIRFDERRDMASLPHALRAVARTHRVVIVSSSRGQALRLKEIFTEEDVPCAMVEPGDVVASDARVATAVGELSAGVFLPGILLLTEHEIFGERPQYRPIRKSRVGHLAESVEDLTSGDFVVHEDRGIGIFRGLRRSHVESVEYEMLAMEYRGGDMLYIPLHAMDKVRKYHAREGAAPVLDRLGSGAWLKTKARVRKKVRIIAERLLRLYAEREVAEGFAFTADTELHREFDSFFLYEETPDQLTAIGEIKREMEGQRPMDRLLSGDVGYGKTEVAMRAAFKAVFDGKQVAVLVPTTLLCEQHLRVFRDRFSAFPARIEGLSRFKSARERTAIFAALARGEIDIVIATHSILRKDLAFKDLGLLVIDEEHRFGVRQKEQIKEISRGVDVLTMTATPIPRTLQMAMSGVRSMSLIETPPEERLAVRTEVSVFDEGMIREAIEFELRRGGQVFFVHNRILDIEKVLRKLRSAVPLARIVVAHGRMRERELESVMLSFLNREADVLLSTAIIGSGLDIPTANTIVIDDAHLMGLADLYQLKGRVGRGGTRGYAYCFVPRGGAMTEDARKRLQALQEHSYMGAGFRLAMKDLEIRGAGNLLGAEQSGMIGDVGFDLYIEMLEREVADIRGVAPRVKPSVAVAMTATALIPEGYITDMTLRLSAYREIAGAVSAERVAEIGAELLDRYGPLPEEAASLLSIMRIKVMAGGLGVRDITQAGDVLRVLFQPGAGMTADRIMAVFGRRVRFLPDGVEMRIEGAPIAFAEGVVSALSEASAID
jgi:transcription-repair coupling factor (superfamily II helicase)